MMFRAKCWARGCGSRSPVWLLGWLFRSFLTRFLRGMLFGVGAVDWLTFATVAACSFWLHWRPAIFPARRAASVDPMQALRTE
jgi:putative ABC transport system permease protein